jgi:hypothetical protein
MITNKSFFRKFSVFFLLLLASSWISACAQNSLDSPEYREDYDRYTKIDAMTDDAERGEKCVLFMKERPKMDNRLLLNIKSLLRISMTRLNDHKEYRKLRLLTEHAIQLNHQDGEAYLFYGRALKGENKMPEALEAFAKAYVIPFYASKEAGKELDRLYKETHKGSLAGKQAIIDNAMKSLSSAKDAPAKNAPAKNAPAKIAPKKK